MIRGQSIAGRFTIITSTYNCKEELAKTAVSIREQDYTNIQWIIADGLSTDGTLKVIDNNSDIITNWFSESDDGIYDAWNKACGLIDGDWVIFLGAGDYFFSSKTLSDVAEVIKNIGIDCKLLYGNVRLQNSSGMLRYTYRKKHLDFWESGRPALPPHQGTFQHSSLFNGERSFDCSYKIAGDSKFLLQAMKMSSCKHVDFVVSVMTDGGVSNHYASSFATQEEIDRVCQELKIKVPIGCKLLCYIRRTLQFFVYSLLPHFIVLKVRGFFDVLKR